jgi:Zn-dependent M28 family amino/carboxypeptidase
MDHGNPPTQHRRHRRRSFALGLRAGIHFCQQNLPRPTRSWALGILVGLCLLVGCMPGLQLPNASAPDASPIASPTPSVPRAPVPEAPAVDQAKLMAHVQALAFERATLADRDRTRTYITTQLKQAGWTVESQSYEYRPTENGRAYQGVNLVAHRPGQTLSQERILVGAHYDSVPGSPGADDNTTGVAIALEMARLFDQQPTPRTLTLAFFDQEESGLVGSSAFVDRAENRDGLQGAIILEMLGYTCEQEGCQKVPAELGVTPPSPNGDFVAVVVDQEHAHLLAAFKRQNQPEQLPFLGLPVPFKGALTPIVLLSDHTPFWLKGIGAVMVSDTAFLRNPHYHQTTDVPASLNPDFLANSAQLVAKATNDLLYP